MRNARGIKHGAENRGGRAAGSALLTRRRTPGDPRPAGGERPPSAPEAAHLSRRRRARESTPGRAGPSGEGQLQVAPKYFPRSETGQARAVPTEPSPSPTARPGPAPPRPWRNGHRRQPDPAVGATAAAPPRPPEAVAPGRPTCAPARLLRPSAAAGGRRGPRADGELVPPPPPPERSGPAAPWRRSACPAPGRWGALRGRRSPHPGSRCAGRRKRGRRDGDSDIMAEAASLPPPPAWSGAAPPSHCVPARRRGAGPPPRARLPASQGHFGDASNIGKH